MRLILIFFVASGVLLLSINHSFSADDPVFQEGVLTIPSINTPDQVGRLQDVKFELTEQGSWQLLEFKEIFTPGLGLAKVDKVELIRIETIPVQILLRAEGYFSNECENLGKINHRLDINHFDIIINSVQPAELVMCPTTIVSFKRTIPLPVYGLSAGIYSYSINGADVSAFELTVDNVLPGDCDEISGCGKIEVAY